MRRSGLWRAALWSGVGLLGGLLAVAWTALLLRDPPGAAPRPSDVIVVLAEEPERALYARTLLARGVAPRLLSTLVDPQCVRAGRAPEACPSGVRNTVDEALLARRALLPEGVRRVTVVTSRHHTLRAALVFKILFAGTGMEVSVVAPQGPLASDPEIAHELWSLVPSAGAAIIGRLSPSLYEWIAQMVST